MKHKIKMMIYLIPFIRFNKGIYKFRIKDFNCYSNQNGISRIRLAIDYMIATYKFKCNLKNYLIFDFYYKNKNEKRKYIVETDGELVDSFNEKSTPDDKSIFEDKARFNETFNKYIQRGYIYCGLHSKTEIMTFIKKYEEVVVKPTNLNGGKGIKIVSINELNNIDEFVEDAINNKYLLEEKLTQNKHILKLNPTSINTIRVVSVVDKFNNVHILGCSIRVGKKGSFVDNMSQGAVGYPIDEETGLICGTGKDYYGGNYFTNDLGNVEMKGFQIPNWKMVKEVINNAAKIVPTIRYVGWDVCIKEKNIELVEGNLHPAPWTYQIGNRPRKEQIIQYL